MLKKEFNIICFNFEVQNVEIVWFNIDNPNNKIIFQQALQWQRKNNSLYKHISSQANFLITKQTNSWANFFLFSHCVCVFFLPLMLLLLCFRTWWWSLVVYHTQGECFRPLVQHFFVVTFFKRWGLDISYACHKGCWKNGTQWCGNHPPIGHMAT
jgi:hypothetical protein